MRNTRKFFAAAALATTAVVGAGTRTANAEMGPLTAPAPGDWQRYVLTRQTREVAPASRTATRRSASASG